MKGSDSLWYSRLRVRRLFWMKFRSALNEARETFNDAQPSGRNKRTFGTVREFVKSFGESHARQFDDVRLGARSEKQRSLTSQAFNLFDLKIFSLYCKASTADELRSFFVDGYSQNDALLSEWRESSELRRP